MLFLAHPENTQKNAALLHKHRVTFTLDTLGKIYSDKYYQFILSKH